MIEILEGYVEGLQNAVKELEKECDNVINNSREEFNMRYFNLLTSAARLIGYTKALTDKLPTEPDTNGKTATEMLLEHAFEQRYPDSIRPESAAKANAKE